jgi:hypothetical protein
MAIAFVNKGTFAAGTTSISPGIPAGMAAGGFMLLTVHTTNQVVSAITGWTAVTSTPVSTGTAGAAGGTRVSTYYRFWQSGDAAPTVAVTGGNCTNGIIAGYSGVDPTTPFDGVTPVATTLAAAATTLTMTGLTTASANDLIFWSVARDVDANSTTGVTAFTNANLTGIAEVHDQTVNTGPGGGIWVGYGFKATAGATGNLTVTQTSSIAVGVTIALRPDLSVTVAVTGVEATGSVGTVGVAATVPTSGVSATGAVGTVDAAVTIGLSGAQATGQVGNADVAVTVPTIGVEATGSVGTVSTAAPITVSLSGVEAAGSVGSVSIAGDVTVSLSGVEATGSVGTVTAGAPPIVVIDDTHDGRRFKKQIDRERKLREKKRQAILDAFERIVEGRPEIAEEIAAPFIAPTTKAAVQTINYDALFADLDRVQRIWDLHLELDDEDVLTLL